MAAAEPITTTRPANNPPQALDQSVTVEADKPVVITLGVADNDPGESLSASIVTPPQPDHGTLGDIDQNTGNVTYTPAPGFKGNDKFTFKATDSQGADSNIATVSITVVPPPTTEVISPPPPPPPKATETFPVNGSSNMPTTTDKTHSDL